MRLEITCDDRLGICLDVLQILRDQEIDLRGIEIDPRGKIYLNFPELAFEDFSHLMPQIRRIPNVIDVKTIPYMPFEREHFEFDLLLSISNSNDFLFGLLDSRLFSSLSTLSKRIN